MVVESKTNTYSWIASSLKDDIKVIFVVALTFLSTAWLGNQSLYLHY